MYEQSTRTEQEAVLGRKRYWTIDCKSFLNKAASFQFFVVSTGFVKQLFQALILSDGNKQWLDNSN